MRGIGGGPTGRGGGGGGWRHKICMGGRVGLGGRRPDPGLLVPDASRQQAETRRITGFRQVITSGILPCLWTNKTRPLNSLLPKFGKPEPKKLNPSSCSWVPRVLGSCERLVSPRTSYTAPPPTPPRYDVLHFRSAPEGYPLLSGNPHKT